MLAFANAFARSANSSWCRIAPQQPAPLAITTSQPWRVSTPTVASLISGRSTCWAQPAEQRHPQPARTLGRDDLRPVDPGRAGDASRRVRQHGAQCAAAAGARLAARQAEPAQRRQPEQRRVRDDRRQQSPQQPFAQRPPIGAFDVPRAPAREMRVVHAGRARRHARQAGEAAIEVFDHRRRRRLAALQHRLGEVDAAARAVELVAQQQIGRAGGEAEAAMHASPQDRDPPRGFAGSASGASANSVRMLRRPRTSGRD